MPRRALTVLIALLASAASASEAPATVAPVTVAPPPASEVPWTIVHEVDGIKVYMRVAPNPDLKEYKAIGVLDVPAPTLSSVLKDRKRYTEFFPYLQENRPISKDGKHYSYERINAPLVAERDYTVEHVDEDLEKGGFRIRFHDANEIGPAPSDKVRVQVVRGMWEVLWVSEGRSQVTYHVYTDPGGSIPNFIINAANKKGVSRAVQALRDRARAILDGKVK